MQDVFLRCFFNIQSKSNSVHVTRQNEQVCGGDKTICIELIEFLSKHFLVHHSFLSKRKTSFCNQQLTPPMSHAPINLLNLPGSNTFNLLKRLLSTDNHHHSHKHALIGWWVKPTSVLLSNKKDKTRQGKTTRHEATPRPHKTTRQHKQQQNTSSNQW